MAKILKFKHNLKYYLTLLEKRKQANDLWGVLETAKAAMAHAKTKNGRMELNLILAETFFAMKQYEQSLFYFFKTLKCPSLKAAAFFGIGKNLAEQKDFSLALDYFEKTLDFDVFNLFSSAVLAWTQHIKKQMDNPKFETQSLQKQAELLILQNKLNEAKTILFGLLQDERTCVLLSVCSLKEKDIFSAKKFAKKALEQNPSSVEANLVLFSAYENPISKQKICEKLKQLQTQKPKDLEKIGVFFAKQKDFSFAKTCFEKWQKIDEFNPKSHLFCALVCQNLKDSQNAIFHLQNARWLDFENPIYEFFLELFKSNRQDFEMLKKLPKDIEKQKLENLMEVFFSGNFVEHLKKSHTLLLDTEWCFSLQNFDVSNVASRAICGVKNADTKTLMQKLLIQKMPAKQKFAICKNALLSENFCNIFLVSNNHVSSFCLTQKELQSLGKLKKAAAKAISFCECFFPEMGLLKQIMQRAKQNKNNQFLVPQNSSTAACFLLFPWPKVFFVACQFFKTDEKFLKDMLLSQKQVEKL